MRQLDAAAIRGRLLIDAVVYAEFSIGYTQIEEADRAVAAVGLDVAEIPRPALFLAGKVFCRYRARGGRRTGVLPDFFIGAHAAVTQIPLLTRDPRPYRTYFADITLDCTGREWAGLDIQRRQPRSAWKGRHLGLVPSQKISHRNKHD